MAVVIRSCRDKETQSLVDKVDSRRFRVIQHQAWRRLDMLRAATKLTDLNLPGLRLEKLLGNRKGQYSIRINDQYRICFEWREDGAYEVEVTDYH
jgi:proteic killer suppression protein